MSSISNQLQLQSAKFLMFWIAANFLGGFIAGFLENNGLQFVSTLFLTGAIVGSLQWCVLRQFGQRFRWWAIASAIGWILGSFLVAFGQTLYAPLSLFLWRQFGLWEVFWTSLVTAPVWIIAMATNQSFMIDHRTHFSPVWILSSLLGAVVQGAVSSIACENICQQVPIAGLSEGLGWSAYGMITGIAFLFLFLERKTSAS